MGKERRPTTVCLIKYDKRMLRKKKITVHWHNVKECICFLFNKAKIGHGERFTFQIEPFYDLTIS